MPSILTQTLYLNLYENGLEVVLIQMVNVIEGRNIYSSEFNKFNNIIAYLNRVNDRELDVIIKVKRYMEAISRYVGNSEEEIQYTYFSDPLCLYGFNKDSAIVDIKWNITCKCIGCYCSTRYSSWVSCRK